MNRLDLRKHSIITVDPAAAKDYDDALSLTRDDNGNRVLGVHIADVTHFVTYGSELDIEAAERATSVYLADRVIPMLPEELCNDKCSLLPNVDRFCVSAFLTFNNDGRLIKRSFARSVIRSKKRLTYTEALEMIHSPRKTLVKELHTLAQQLRARRFAAGALNIESADVEVKMSPDGKRVLDIFSVPQDEAHQMIEEAMVAANEAVATELSARKIRAIERYHEESEPDEKLKRAIYSTTQRGHFGLAKKHYTHFTSPIRRYVDITVHRQLLGEPRHLPNLARIAEHCNAREEYADEMERDSLDEVKLRFLQQQIDEKRPIVYEARVTGVLHIGVFVEIPRMQFGGLVPAATLKRGNLKNRFPVGTPLRVSVCRVDHSRRLADFVLA